MKEIHNHVWRDTILPTPKKSKEELLKTIKNCGDAGYWLKEEEMKFVKKLVKKNKIILCCNGTAATIKHGER